MALKVFNEFDYINIDGLNHIIGHEQHHTKARRKVGVFAFLNVIGAIGVFRCINWLLGFLLVKVSYKWFKIGMVPFMSVLGF